MKVILIHGGGAKAERVTQRWQNMLFNQLPDTNIIAPVMPQEENTTYESWKSELERLIGTDEDIILVGHSFGGTVMLKYFAEHEAAINVKALLIVAAPYFGIDEEWTVPGFDTGKDFTRLAAIAHIYLYHSHDDAVVPFYHFEAFQKLIPQAEAKAFDGQGHNFRNNFPELAHDIAKLTGIEK